MRSRIGASMLLGTLIVLVRLEGCDINEHQCCYDEIPHYFNTWQEMQTALAECEGVSNYGCDMHRGPESTAFCMGHPQDCCEHFPALASQVLANTPNTCVSWTSAQPQPTEAPVPLESQVQPPSQAIAPVELPPEKNPELPADVFVLPETMTVKVNPIPEPKAEVVPASTPCLAAPIMFDPPDGKSFAAMNTVFRWKPGGELQPDLVYDVLVSTDGGKTSTSIGTTQDTNLPIDFLKWNLAGMTGNFSWTVRIRDASGKYVSCESLWFGMTLTEIKGGPGAAPIPNQPAPPPVKPPCYTKPCP